MRAQEQTTAAAKERDGVEASVPRAPIRVFIVAELCLYGQGLALILDGEANIEVVGNATNSVQAVARIRGLQRRPDFVLVDVADPRGVLGIRRIRRALPGICIVALSVPETEHDVVGCAEAGAVAYVTRQGCSKQLVATIIRATRGEAVCSPTMTAVLLRRIGVLGGGASGFQRGAGLTAREIEIVELIERGLSNKQIAATLQVELTTVKNHVHRILRKLGVERRAEAAAWVRAESAGAGRDGLSPGRTR